MWAGRRPPDPIGSEMSQTPQSLLRDWLNANATKGLGTKVFECLFAFASETVKTVL